MVRCRGGCCLYKRTTSRGLSHPRRQAGCVGQLREFVVRPEPSTGFYMKSPPSGEMSRDARAMPRRSVTCVIATRNRRAALADALESVRAQRGVVVETVVLDDASYDGTAECVTSEFPEVHLQRYDVRQERLVLRNQGIAGARNEFVLVLDDDCYLTDENSIRNALAWFDNRAVAVVCIPIIEP